MVGFVEGEDAVVLELRKTLRQCTCDVLMSMPVSSILGFVATLTPLYNSLQSIASPPTRKTTPCSPKGLCGVCRFDLVRQEGEMDLFTHRVTVVFTGVTGVQLSCDTCTPRLSEHPVQGSTRRIGINGPRQVLDQELF